MPLAPHFVSPQPTSGSGSCRRQFCASSYSPCADNAVLPVCAVCLSALSPQACSDATGACSFPMQVQPTRAWLLMPPRSTLNQCGTEPSG